MVRVPRRTIVAEEERGPSSFLPWPRGSGEEGMAEFDGSGLSLKELRLLIEESGLNSNGCIDKADLRGRACEALERLRLPGARLGPISTQLLAAATNSGQEASANNAQDDSTGVDDTAKLEQENSSAHVAPTAAAVATPGAPEPPTVEQPTAVVPEGHEAADQAEAIGAVDEDAFCARRADIMSTVANARQSTNSGVPRNVECVVDDEDALTAKRAAIMSAVAIARQSTNSGVPRKATAADLFDDLEVEQRSRFDQDQFMHSGPKDKTKTTKNLGKRNPHSGSASVENLGKQAFVKP